MNLTIDVTIPDGYEFVDFRIPVEGDEYLCMDDLPNLVLHYCSETHSRLRVIIRKKFVWPTAFKKGLWAFRDPNGVWRISYSKPGVCIAFVDRPTFAIKDLTSVEFPTDGPSIIQNV